MRASRLLAALVGLVALSVASIAIAQSTPPLRILDSSSTTPKPQRNKLRLLGVGATVACADNAGAAQTDCTVTAAANGVTSVTSSAGIASSPNPIVSTGSLSLDLTYTPTWTGVHTFKAGPIVASAAATSGATLQNSPAVTLRGAYWNGSASVSADATITNVVSATTPSNYVEFVVGGVSAFRIHNSASISMPDGSAAGAPGTGRGSFHYDNTYKTAMFGADGGTYYNVLTSNFTASVPVLIYPNAPASGVGKEVDVVSGNGTGARGAQIAVYGGTGDTGFSGGDGIFDAGPAGTGSTGGTLDLGILFASTIAIGGANKGIFLPKDTRLEFYDGSSLAGVSTVNRGALRFNNSTHFFQYSSSTAAYITLADVSSVQTITGKTMSGGSNTFSSIANASLTNSSVTVTAGTGIGGGGAVALGSSVSLNVSYGTTSTTATVGNDTRLPPAPGTQGRVLYDSGSAWVALGVGSSGQFLQTQGASANPQWATVSGAGTVTSVGLSLPSIITVTGSPVTTSGTLTGTLATQTANFAFLGPTTGAAAAPTFRAFVTADVSGVAVTNLTASNGVATSAAVGSAALSLTYGSSANTVTQGNDTRLPPTPGTQGNILYDNGSAWVALGVGSNGQLLATQGASANPHWITASGTGTVTSVSGASGVAGTVTTSGSLTLDQTFAANWTGAGTYTKTAIGATVASAPFLTLTNTTAAAVNAQQWSPGLVLHGNVWNTTATAATNTTDLMLVNRPVQGSSATLGSELVMFWSNNGGAYGEQWKYATTTTTFSVSSGGALGLGPAVTLTGARGDGVLNSINVSIQANSGYSSGATTVLTVQDNSSTGRLHFGVVSGVAHVFGNGEAVTCTGTCTQNEAMCWTSTAQTVQQCGTSNQTIFAGVAASTITNGTLVLIEYGQAQVKCETGTTAGTVAEVSVSTAGRIDTPVTPLAGGVVGVVTKTASSNLCLVKIK